MKCPRCSFLLRMVEPSPRWLRHFCCDECWSCWHLEITRILATDEKNHRIRYWKNDTFLRFGRNARLELAA